MQHTIHPTLAGIPPPLSWGPARTKELPDHILQRKIFVGLLNNTTEQDFYLYFSKFGPIEDYFVQRDSSTG